MVWFIDALTFNTYRDSPRIPRHLRSIKTAKSIPD